MDSKYELKEIAGRLSVIDKHAPSQKPIYIDFNETFEKLKKSKLSIKKDPLARALGLDKNKNIKVVDGTLGFAVDTLKIIFWGATVQGYEKNFDVFRILSDAYKRLDENDTYFLKSKLQIQNKDITEVDFSTLDFDVLYLDPMFFDAEKSAKSKKNMQWLREVIHHNENYEKTIANLIEDKKNIRIVVKRPLQKEPLFLPKNGDIKGKLIRFDIYKS